MRLAVRIMRHMSAHGLSEVSVPRVELEARPGITPNYVKRALATMPRLQGTTDLPSIDNLLATRFRPAAFRFASA